ncbi:MAG TPA: hypothetical protein VMW78_04015 [Anaerolineae bacterium]|nr:hypothetical protein [Anaerolineae bacterium]
MPFRNLSKTLLLIIIWVSFFLLFPYGSVRGETAKDIIWQKIVTKYTIICYQTQEDLKEFSKHVDYYPGEWGIKRLFPSSDSNDLINNLKKKVDALYERVQEILDMRKKMKKVTINIYNNKEQLHAAYFDIYKKNYQYKAWYIYEYHVIYVNFDDINEGILAHEMAHSIIDQYLTVRPPRVTAEILARYVDSHLFD